MASRWQVLDRRALKELKAGKWSLMRHPDHGQSRSDEVSPKHAFEASRFDLEL
jgi:hypothetical protein